MQYSEMTKTHFLSLASMTEHVGQVIGVSEWFLLTQELISDFGRVTFDEQWIHVDAERARKESPYGSTIAHGFLVTSLIPKFLSETISFANMKMGINYGSDKVRFINAVPSGSEIRGEIELMELHEIKDGCKYKTKVTVRIRGQEKPACIMEMIAVVVWK